LNTISETQQKQT